VGRWLANWVTRGEPGEDLSSVSLDRFENMASDRDWVRRQGEEFYGGYYSVASMSVT
jgi:hypothetical protein